MFTTAQAHWRTKIPVPTIQRYIKDFANQFSEAARRPDKSRRYTESDIQKLNVIRKMYQNHAPEYEIRLALDGVIESHALPVSEFENMLQIAEAARLAQIEAEKSAQRANESLLGIESRLRYYSDKYFETRQMNRELEARIKWLESHVKIILKDLGFEKVREPAQPIPPAQGKPPTPPAPPTAPSLWEMFKQVMKGD